MKRRWLTLLGVAIAVLAISAVAVYQWNARSIASARQLMQEGELARTRLVLEGKLIQPALTDQQKWESTYLLALASLNDTGLDPQKTIARAIPMLESIPPSSQVYPEAQVALAKHWFIVLAMPKKAERLLKNALHVRSDLLEAKDLLFSIYTATLAMSEADRVFWDSIDQAPEDQKITRFQQWFCSQFTRNTANRNIDELLNVVDSKGEEFTILNRLVLFKNQEPDQGCHFGALADWWINQGETKIAMEVLEKGKEVSKDTANGAYLRSFTNAMVLQGAFDFAEKAMKAWPEDERQLAYWRNLGVIHHEQHHYKEAIAAFEQAVNYWPAPVDPDLFYRMQTIYEELGETEKARAAENRNKEIRLWMEENWPLILRGVRQMEHPEAVQVLIDFFTVARRPDVVAFLQEYSKSLPPPKEAFDTSTQSKRDPELPPNDTLAVPDPTQAPAAQSSSAK